MWSFYKKFIILLVQFLQNVSLFVQFPFFEKPTRYKLCYNYTHTFIMNCLPFFDL